MNLGVFMTFRSSLVSWSEHGLAARELKYYDYLSNHGIKVFLITYGDSDDKYLLQKKYPEFSKNIEVIPILSKGSKNSRINCFISSLKFLLLNYYFLRKLKYLKSKQFSGSWLPAIAAVITGNKFIFRYGYDIIEFNKLNKKGYFRRFVTYTLKSFAKKISHRIISTSNHEFKYKYKFTHQENWIDLEKFNEKVPSNGINKYISNGRLEKQKNHMLLLEVAKIRSLSVSLIGDGSEKKVLQEYVENHNLDVTFLGRISYEKVACTLKIHEVFISTTHFEGNPKAVIEALAAGLICIVPKIPSITSIISDRYNGFLHENTQESLIKAIDNLGNLSDEQIKEIKQNAVNSVAERYKISTIAERELAIYRQK